MGVAGMVTPIRRETFKNLQLNAGAFLVGFDYTGYTDAAALKTALADALKNPEYLLGATRGGGSFVVTSEIREPDVDGKRYRFKGGAFVDSVDAQLTGTLVEIMPERFAQVLATGESSKNGMKTVVTMHTAIQDADYLPSLVWIGDMSDGGLVMIALKNALNANGMTLTFTDKGEGTIPFEFHAYQDSVEDYDYAPFEVVFLDGVDASTVSITPTYSTLRVGDTLAMALFPADATVTWASDDTDIATVSNGTVTAVAPGTVSITATADNGAGVATVRVIAAT